MLYISTNVIFVPIYFTPACSELNNGLQPCTFVKRRLQEAKILAIVSFEDLCKTGKEMEIVKSISSHRKQKIVHHDDRPRNQAPLD